MARVDLRCGSCGYQFFVSDAQLAKPEGVKCPSCLALVGISGPAAGGPPRKPVRVLEASPDAGASKMKLYLGIGIGAVVLAVAVAMMFMGSTPPPAEPEPEAKRPSGAPLVQQPKPTTSSSAPRPSTPAPAKPTTSSAPAPASTSAAAPAAAPAATPKPAVVPDLPAELLKSVREDLLSLKPWHLNLAISGPEKSKLDGLLTAGKGGTEEVDFLKGIVNGARLRVVREEAMLLQEAYARLEKEALEGLPVDKVVMNDGRVLHGKVVEETADLVKLERKFAGGVAGVMPLPRPGIKDVQKGKGLGGEFKTRWDASRKGGAAALAPVLAWCKESTLPLQASLTAHAILAEDPGHTDARQEVGLASDPISRMQEAEKQGGFITYEGRRWVPRELKDKFLRDGYAIVDGQWMSKKERLIGVPGLFRYETQADKPVQITGPLAHEEIVSYTSVQDPEKADVKQARRFYAATPMTVTATRTNAPALADADVMIMQDRAAPPQGTAMKGEVYITVPIGAPLLEASVMTSSEVKTGGQISVFLQIDGNRVPLYNCSSGKDDKTRKLPDIIRGKTQVELVVEISGKATYRAKQEKRRIRAPKRDSDRVITRGLDYVYNQLIPEYPAVLFPSNNNTIEVFRLTAVTADPAPGLDKLFENAKDVLK